MGKHWNTAVVIPIRNQCLPHFLAPFTHLSRVHPTDYITYKSDIQLHQRPSDVITLLTTCILKMPYETTFLDSRFSIHAWTNPFCPEIWSQVVHQPIFLVPDVLRSVLQQQCESGAYVGCFSALCHDHVPPHWNWMHHKEVSVPFHVKHCVQIYRPQICTSHQISVFCCPETVDEYGYYICYCICNARLSSGWHEWHSDGWNKYQPPHKITPYDK